MSYKVTGTICHIDETREYGQNGFRKRQIVLAQEDGKYDNFVPLEFLQDRCDDADELSVGSEITIEFKLSGRKWRNPEGEYRYFLNLEVVDVIDLQLEHAVEASQAEEEPDELPF